MLICANLILVTVQLFAHIVGRKEKESIERTISRFLPYYVVWSGIVAFIFPFIFEMEKIFT